MKQTLQIRIVLVRPRNPLNIGAAARAMANFGFDDLWVVNPYGPAWRRTVAAVGAEELVRRARVTGDLQEAIADCGLVLGTTAVKDRVLEQPVVSLPELNAFLDRRAAGGARAALLFGSEKTGLNAAEREPCNAFVTVPTSAVQPSMNLSQAVAVCCYELSKVPKRLYKRGAPAATAETRELLIRQALDLFDAAGYLPLEPREMKLRKVRQALLRWTPSKADARLLHGIIRYLRAKLK